MQGTDVMIAAEQQAARRFRDGQYINLLYNVQTYSQGTWGSDHRALNRFLEIQRLEARNWCNDAP